MIDKLYVMTMVMIAAVTIIVLKRDGNLSFDARSIIINPEAPKIKRPPADNPSIIYCPFNLCAKIATGLT